MVSWRHVHFLVLRRSCKTVEHGFASDLRFVAYALFLFLLLSLLSPPCDSKYMKCPKGSYILTRAEKELFTLAEGTKLRVIAYRPDYVGPTEEEAHLDQDLLYWFFAPVGATVRAQQIGEAMLDATVGDSEFKNGDKLATGSILRYSDAYGSRIK